ncbi:hypothetical protein BGZ58_005677 [Dissophora ornata]|nr:hypothetical protein BGZ58_005677 [Dissophora ornata]
MEYFRTIHFIVAALTLASFVSVSIGKKTVGSSVSPLPDLATEAFFHDSVHLGINIALFITSFYYYYPIIPAIAFLSLGLNYGIRDLTAILIEHHGCRDPFFDNTRTRCRIQYGVSICEILWSILVMFEACVLIQFVAGRKLEEMVLKDSIRRSAARSAAASGTVESTVVSSHTSTTEQDGGENEEEEEQLPKYTQTRPSDQPPIVDAAAHPPERLSNVVASVLNSEAAEADPVATSDSPPYTEQCAESTVINMAAELGGGDWIISGNGLCAAIDVEFGLAEGPIETITILPMSIICACGPVGLCSYAGNGSNSNELLHLKLDPSPLVAPARLIDKSG